METEEGDPSGRRIATRRVAYLAEAGRIGRLFRGVVKSAGLDTGPLDQVVSVIKAHERIELERAGGRIEPRKRFKGGSGQPLMDRRDRSLLFVDECGRATDRNDSFFALGAIAITAGEADVYRSRADALKRRFFGEKHLTLHEPDIRHAKGPYYFEGDVGRHADFRAAIDDLVVDTVFVAFGVGIRRRAFDMFVADGTDAYLPADVYSVAIQMLLERCVDYLATTAPGHPLGRVTFESQGPREDAEHQREYCEVLLEGTQWVPDNAFRQWLETGVGFTPKQGSDPMELADMFARDVYEWVRGDCQHEPERMPLFARKIYCREDRRHGKFGVKVFPDSDIRDRIEEHRARSGQ